MSVPDISIIIAAHNAEQYLQRCLDSVEAQRTHSLNIEVIIVDDGSTDRTSAIADDYASLHSGVKVFHTTRKGQGHARNIGLSHCNGRWITFIDSDDEWYPASLEKLVSYGDSNECEIVQGQIDIFHTDGTIEKLSDNDTVYSHSEAMRQLIKDKLVRSYLCGRIYRKEIFEGLTIPENMIYEDYAVMHKIFFRAKGLSIIGVPHYKYYRREDSLSSKFDSSLLDLFEGMFSRYEFLKENMPDCVALQIKFMWLRIYQISVSAKCSKPAGYENITGFYSKMMREHKAEFDRCLKNNPVYRMSSLGSWPYRFIYRFFPSMLNKFYEA